jgi:transposase-like protein
VDSRDVATLDGGRDYPRDYAELRAWFATDDACRDYLAWLRWPNGFVCPRCDAAVGTARPHWSYWCGGCRRSTSVTAGTIFDSTRTPLTIWFAAAWYMTSAKNGVAAATLQRLLGFGSYQTSWAMLHRFRTAMVRPNRDKLAGDVEVDEVFFGGTKPGRRGRGAKGKTLVLLAVELRSPKGFGRCRMRVVDDASAASIRQFLQGFVERGSTIVTDGFTSYPAAVGDTWAVRTVNLAASGSTASKELPAVHRVASLSKRWLLGTHQGAVEGDHLQSYLDEFTFRFNRRRSDFRGLLFYRLLEQSVQVEPVTYRELIVSPRPGRPRQKPGPNRAPAPPSLERPRPSAYPWRVASGDAQPDG